MPGILIVGHSHAAAMKRACPPLVASGAIGTDVGFILLRGEEFTLPQADDPHAAKKNTPSQVDGVNKKAVRKSIEKAAADAVILYLNGNEHNVLGLFKSSATTQDVKMGRLVGSVWSTLHGWAEFLLPLLPARVALLLPPPPIADEGFIRQFLYKQNNGRYKVVELEPAAFRLELWRRQCTTLRAVCRRLNLRVIELPASVFDADGFLAKDCWGSDPTHGNVEYGCRVLPEAVAEALSLPASPRPAAAGEGDKPHPYVALPDYCFWKQSISQVPAEEVNPVTSPLFRIQVRDKVATAGSCFAQHISKRLRAGGFHFLVTEQAGGDEAENRARGFYDFSARYGNIYTARQLLQLFDRAFGYFRPLERVWPHPGGGFCDPFRPRIEPEGFPTEEAVVKDTQKHLKAVRKMFRQMDVFVFTLGLTECWVSRLDGAAYPVAPGVAGGDYDPQKHVFVNFSVAEVTADLRTFLAKLRLVNPRARVLLTVSPVPLVATAADRHVLVSTVYSKSVLRVAAEEIVMSHSNVCYFPSYEIITGPHAGGAYFEEDRRSVTEVGVDHVMRIFMGRMTGAGSGLPATSTDGGEAALAEIEAWSEALCDEEMLER